MFEIHSTKTITALLSLVFVLTLYFSPLVISTSFNQFDNYQRYEELNQRIIDIDVEDDSILIKATLKSGEIRDVIDFEISAGVDGLQLKIQYGSDVETGESELVYEMTFAHIIEYVDLNADGVYNASEDHFVQEVDLEDFLPFFYVKMNLEDGKNLHFIRVSTIDGIFSCYIYAVEGFYLLEGLNEVDNTLIVPSRIKFNIVIENFNYLNESSRLALSAKFKAAGDFEEAPETEDEQKGFAVGEVGIKIGVNNTVGFFSWKSVALINGIMVEQVKTSSILEDELDPEEQGLYFNYPRASVIFHDPKLGIEGILRVPSSFNPLLLYILITIIFMIVAFSIVISKKEYREYLLNRVLHIDADPHRLNMEDVLENENRSKIISCILEDPGIHFNELLRRVGISAGTLAWHLDILETYKVIRKIRIGQYLVYFSYLDENPFSKMDPKISKSRTTLEVLQLISDHPGLYQNQIAKRLDLNHKTVKYHLDKLLEVDLIYSERKGRHRGFYPKIREIKVEEDTDL